MDNNSVILLKGELGAGKTTFTKSINQTLGGKFDDVSSPTFSYVNSYRESNLLHFDLFRVKNNDFDLEFISYLEDYNYPMIVEWFENLSSNIIEMVKKSRKTIFIEIKIINETTRQFYIY